jgi:hypothetical protein
MHVFAAIDAALWTTWVPLFAGTLAAWLVLGSATMYRRWRHRLTYASREEDLPWDNLLTLLEKRNHDREAAGLPLQETSEAELDELLGQLPGGFEARPVELPEDREFKTAAGSDRRTGRRRWGNPTEVHIVSTLSEERLHGIVVNRSTGGLGIFADAEVPAGTLVTIRPVEAPPFVKSVFAEIRHCQPVGKGFVLGCKLRTEIPWKIRVWFG